MCRLVCSILYSACGLVRRFRVLASERTAVTNCVVAMELRTHKTRTYTLYLDSAFRWRLFIYCRGAFGGPSPAGLTACMALPPRPPQPRPCPNIYFCPLYTPRPLVHLCVVHAHAPSHRATTHTPLPTALPNIVVLTSAPDKHSARRRRLGSCVPRLAHKSFFHRKGAVYLRWDARRA